MFTNLAFVIKIINIILFPLSSMAHKVADDKCVLFIIGLTYGFRFNQKNIHANYLNIIPG